MIEENAYKVRRFFKLQFILIILLLVINITFLFLNSNFLDFNTFLNYSIVFGIFQILFCVIYAFKYRISKSLLNSVKLYFIFLHISQILISLTFYEFHIFYLSSNKILIFKTIKLILMSIILFSMIYLLIKDSSKNKLLKIYTLRDSFFIFIPFAFIIYKNSKYFFSSYFYFKNPFYSEFLLKLSIIFVFLKGFLIILIFVKTIYSKNDKKSSYILLIYFYFSNLNYYIIAYFKNPLYKCVSLDFICSLLILLTLYYLTLEKENNFNSNFIDNSLKKINNSWINFNICIFPVSFSVIYLILSYLKNKDLKGLENLIVIIIIMFILIIRDFTLRKDNLKLIRSVKKANEIDYLTNIYSRNYFMKKLEVRKDNYALFFIDIRNFKDINNIFGHIAGDKVLIEVSDKFKELKSFLDSDILYCRYSGNRFALVSKLNQIDIILKFFDNFENINIKYNSDVIHVNFNIGYSLNKSNTPLDLIIQEADYALMRAKTININDNSIIMYDDNLKTDLEHINILKKDFKSDLENNRFSLVFQPKISVKELKLVGFETLLRWKHNTLGTISPSKFVPIIENLGEISSLDLYVFEKACKFQSDLLDKGLKFKCSINLSLNTLKSYDAICKIIEIYNSYKIPKHLITGEILENVSLESNKKTIFNIELLRENGISISIDDFGTGYSSLSQISNIYFDELKIPREFVIDARKPNKIAVIETISILAKKLNVTSVVEGVETYADLQLFTNLGFDIVQGYYFSKPLNKKDFLKYIASSTLEIKHKLEKDSKLINSK